MRAEDLNRFREQVESVANLNPVAKDALAVAERRKEMIELGERMSSPATMDPDALRSPVADSITAIRAAHERSTFDLNDFEPRSVVVPPPLPSPPRIGPGSLRKAFGDILREGNAESAEREAEMVAGIEAMRTALVESSQRETESFRRAKEAERREDEARKRAERRERWMMAMTALAVLIAALQAAASVF
jgi:hypothetical protein